MDFGGSNNKPATRSEGLSSLGFTDFIRAIESPDLRDVARHWNDARATKRMPAWSDIDSTAIARHLPIVWSWKYDRSTDTFTGRLAGEAIVEAFGVNLRDQRMQDFYAKEHYEQLFAKHKRVVNEPAFVRGRGRVFVHAQRYGLGERIIMPLADDGLQGDGIFGATVHTMGAGASPHPAPLDPGCLELEQFAFFALD